MGKVSGIEHPKCYTDVSPSTLVRKQEPWTAGFSRRGASAPLAEARDRPGDPVPRCILRNQLVNCAVTRSSIELRCPVKCVVAAERDAGNGLAAVRTAGKAVQHSLGPRAGPGRRRKLKHSASAEITSGGDGGV